VLAQLDAIPGVESASVDVTGRHFILTMRGKADPSRIRGKILKVLGTDAKQLEDPRFSEITSGGGEEELWLDSRNIRKLSLLEARMLSDTWGIAAAAAAELDPDTAVYLCECLRSEFVREFDRIRIQGGTSDRNWYVQAFPDVFDRAIRRLGEIPPARAAALRASLLQQIG
jgi:hypothetical protein